MCGDCVVGGVYCCCFVWGGDDVVLDGDVCCEWWFGLDFVGNRCVRYRDGVRYFIVLSVFVY